MTGRLRLSWAEAQGRTCLVIAGWTAAELRGLADAPPAELARRLSVLPSGLVDTGVDMRALQSVAGRFEVDGDAVRFVPRFAFMDGASYTLLIAGTPTDDDRPLEVAGTLERPARTGTPVTDVVALYPTSAEVPVNLLRMYVHFSRPMSEGWAARAVSVGRADTGEPLRGVFLALRSELWDRDRTRLTLFLDPGRIKRGLLPNEEQGYPLIEGVPIMVAVHPDFRDADGLPLRNGLERRYDVGEALRARVTPENWGLRAPDAGSRGPLTLEFDRPLDNGLLQHTISVIGSDGALLSGELTVGDGERTWHFIPQTPWAVGEYTIAVATRLEDCAGNSVARVFDRDLTRAEDAPGDTTPATLTFTCAPTRRTSPSLS